jgi:hypothetical protein
LDVVKISKRPDHADASITLKVYTPLGARACYSAGYFNSAIASACTDKGGGPAYRS